MSRSRILTSVLAAGLSMAALGACSAESLTERAVSFGLEQAIEGEQDIDLDFGDDGSGGFSISTEEGDFAINFDEDSGGIVFDTDEGEGVISFDENGIVYDTDEGEGVISFDQENGAINFDTDQGDGSITLDEDAGTLTVETEDGEVVRFGTTDQPDNWPAYIGVPETLVPGSAAFSTFDAGSEGVMTSGQFAHADDDPFPSNVVDALKSAGWTEELVSQDGPFFAILNNEDATAQVVGQTGTTIVTFLTG